MSNINKILTFEVVSVNDNELFFHVTVLPVSKQIDVIQTITLSDKWRKYNFIGLSEKAVLTKFNEIGPEVLEATQEEFDARIELEGKQVVLDDFIDTILEINNNFGITNFPFQAGQQYHDFEEHLSDYLETVAEDYIITKIPDIVEE